ncbi:carboxymuconolactone decarboxylase family protein [Gallibacterium salpingitidis]|uniref:Alkylhydroperoxidase n=1 Tax=Gallibacterium salpingitidis TaxID=505341 RepID=A0A1A7P2Y8_9PAST|nr:carboxymuconolactone decarboxylase family protein [Gallibacterium salpingitidis]OBW96368.1 alkylhydroperoxidase [Gallibacterium salpingitidis]
MKKRVNHFATVPQLAQAITNFSEQTAKISIEKSLQHLIDIRASQLNQCAFCLDMHVKEAKIDGERELRLYHLTTWRKSHLFSDREKAALALTETLTQIDGLGVNDELYAYVSQHFSDVEISELTFKISLINTWNRLMLLSLPKAGSMDNLFGLDKAQLS